MNNNPMNYCEHGIHFRACTICGDKFNGRPWLIGAFVFCIFIVGVMVGIYI